MNEYEIAMQLTLSALEKGRIQFIPYSAKKNEEAEQFNAFNAKQISDFYNTILKELEFKK